VIKLTLSFISEQLLFFLFVNKHAYHTKEYLNKTFINLELFQVLIVAAIPLCSNDLISLIAQTFNKVFKEQ